METNNFNFIGYLGGEIIMDGRVVSLLKSKNYQHIFNSIEKKFYSVFKDVSGILFIKTPYYILVDHTSNSSPTFYHALNLWIEDIFPKIVRYRLIINIFPDRKILLRPAKLNKMNAINHIFKEKELHKSMVVYIGDNFLDEEVFLNLRDKGITIRVGHYSASSNAHHTFGSDIELVQFLNLIYKFYS
jgi:hydroxymethylpyrimidine pyrophosphatase-like HAD family hydrolase